MQSTPDPDTDRTATGLEPDLGLLPSESSLHQPRRGKTCLDHDLDRTTTGPRQPGAQFRPRRMARGSQAVPLPARAGDEGVVREGQGDLNGG